MRDIRPIHEIESESNAINRYLQTHQDTCVCFFHFNLFRNLSIFVEVKFVEKSSNNIDQNVMLLENINKPMNDVIDKLK